MIPGLPDAAGRDAVTSLLKQRFGSSRTRDFKAHRREIEVTGESAYELAGYSEVHEAQGEANHLDGRYLIEWKREGGGWRVHRNLSNYSNITPVEKTD